MSAGREIVSVAMGYNNLLCPWIRHRKGMGQTFSPGLTLETQQYPVMNISSNSAVLCISGITVNLFGKPLVKRQDE